MNLLGLVKFGKHIGAEETTQKDEVFVATFMKYKLDSVLHFYNKARRSDIKETRYEDAKVIRS